MGQETQALIQLKANVSLSFLPSEARLLLPGRPPRLAVSRPPGSAVQFAGCTEGRGRGPLNSGPDSSGQTLHWPQGGVSFSCTQRLSIGSGNPSVQRQGKLRCLGKLAGREVCL